eukprot:EG_transcript_28427
MDPVILSKSLPVDRVAILHHPKMGSSVVHHSAGIGVGCSALFEYLVGPAILSGLAGAVILARRGSARSIHATAWRAAAAGDPDPLPRVPLQVMEGDVVCTVGPTPQFYAVTEPQGSRPGTCRAQRIKERVQDSNEWFWEHDDESVEIHLSDMDAVDYYYSMRMITDRRMNPHGEHAEPMWQLARPDARTG